MAEETNESSNTAPEPDSTEHAEKLSSDNIAADAVQPGAPEDGKECALRTNNAAEMNAASVRATSGTVPEVDGDSHECLPNTDVDDALATLSESDKDALAARLSDAELVERMEKYVFVPVQNALKPLSDVKATVKGIITEHHALILEAKKRFHAQGRRVPVIDPNGAKSPTYNEWLKANLTCSDRYVRKVLKELSASLTMMMPPPDKKKSNSNKRQREERIMSLAVEQARAVFENPERARELATALLNEVNPGGCTPPDTNANADVQASPAKCASVRSAAALPQMIRPEASTPEQVPASAVQLATSVIEQGLGGKFPAVLDLLKAANIPVPSVVSAPAQEQETIRVASALPKGGDWKKLLLGYRQDFGKHTDAAFSGLDESAVKTVFLNFTQGIADFVCRDSDKKLRVTVETTGHKEHI